MLPLKHFLRSDERKKTASARVVKSRIVTLWTELVLTDIPEITGNARKRMMLADDFGFGFEYDVPGFLVLSPSKPVVGSRYQTDNNTDPGFNEFVNYTLARWEYTYP